MLCHSYPMRTIEPSVGTNISFRICWGKAIYIKIQLKMAPYINAEKHHAYFHSKGVVLNLGKQEKSVYSWKQN